VTAEVTAAEVSSTAASTASEAPTNSSGAINASPNTGGIPFPPIAAALLALAAVPVIVITSKKKTADGHAK
jgi:hypothetical protein